MSSLSEIIEVLTSIELWTVMAPYLVGVVMGLLLRSLL